jgi:prevent-host-death family protein
MKTAAVAELKASLSQYLAGVKAGGEVVVTERGKPIAKIVPIAAAGGEEEQRLRALEGRGLLRLGRGKLPKGFWSAPRPADPEGLVRQALIEEREEGR